MMTSEPESQNKCAISDLPCGPEWLHELASTADDTEKGTNYKEHHLESVEAKSKRVRLLPILLMALVPTTMLGGMCVLQLVGSAKEKQGAQLMAAKASEFKFSLLESFHSGTQQHRPEMMNKVPPSSKKKNGHRTGSSADDVMINNGPTDKVIWPEAQIIDLVADDLCRLLLALRSLLWAEHLLLLSYDKSGNSNHQLEEEDSSSNRYKMKMIEMMSALVSQANITLKGTGSEPDRDSVEDDGGMILMEGEETGIQQLLAGLANSILRCADDRVRSSLLRQIFAGTVLMLVIIMAPLMFLLVRDTAWTIKVFSIALVRRSRELKREKRRSDRLLRQMLPPAVARQLTQRKQVPAESFEQVTIYFSDIVGFTNLCGSSSPMEVIMLLNSLYRLFDNELEKYDVYKVETIGDAYMVASGVPQRNEDNHSLEIAGMALDLINSLKNFKIPHRSDQ